MRVDSLYGKYKDEEIYIIGTGPSLRLFPVSFFWNKITIGLNQAWKTVENLQYILTIHPETLPPNTKKYKIITKRKKGLIEKEPYYLFKNNEEVTDFNYCYSSDNTLYVGRGIHTAAMVLAAKMGARWAILVGCDLTDLAGQHHATDQSVRFHGLDPKGVYTEYYLNARELRGKLNKHYGIQFMSLTPFLGLNAEEDFEFLLKENQYMKFDKPIDDSDYSRKNFDFWLSHNS